jgi:predicted secreted hydrolase
MWRLAFVRCTLHSMIFRLLALSFVAGCALAPAAAFRFEEHEGPHDAGIEWWYLSGFLDGDKAFFVSFFRTRAPDGSTHRYLIYDLIDLPSGTGRYRSLLGSEAFDSAAALVRAAARLAPRDPEVARWAEAVARGTLPGPHGLLEGASLEPPGGPLHLRYGPHSFASAGPGRYSLSIHDREFRLDLTLRSVTRPLYIGGTGLTGIERPEDMHYYTLPRLDAEGTLDGRRVRGELWYDHQWGESWSPGRVGWSWWGIVLDDGEAINAFEVRDRRSGSVLQRLVTSSRRSVLREPTFTPLRHWTSPRTGMRYPVAWRIQAAGLDVQVEPIIDDRELPALGDAGMIWEGPVRTTPSGRGFQELVGYAADK